METALRTKYETKTGAPVTDRPYRKSLGREKTFDILRQEANAGKIDKRVVKCLIEMENKTI